MDHKPHFSLGKARSVLVSAAVACIALRIVAWAIEPLLPYIVGGVLLITVLGIALYRSNHF